MRVLIYAIGIVMFFEGVPYLISPNKTKEMMRIISEMPESSLRIIGGVFVAAGFFLLYFI